MAQVLYSVVYLASATDPADDATGWAQIKNGQDGSGAAAVWAGNATWTGSGQQLTASGLTAGALYAAASVVYDDVGLTYSNRVLATEFTTLARTSSGALSADAATVAGTAVRMTPHAATGALSAQAATVAGTAAHLTLHTSSGALEAQAATVAGTADLTPAGGTSHASSGALSADAAVVAGTAAHLTLHTSTGALSADAATVAGTAAHLTLHTSTGALVADPASVSGAAVDETTYVAPVPRTGAGKSRKSRKSRQRYVLTIDGRDLIVSSPEEAQALIDDVKVKAEAVAQTALDRANASKRRPVGKVLRDARKALELPTIEAPPEVADYAAKVMREIRERYESQLRDIEITALLHKQAQQEEDDEDILLLIA